eukprot:TRINITY_DN2608_c0_g1_i1.p1 TRINITY_DN2608_c0_g1~~TRINITY_DN2608_c0_g1_i1.p1  ORF type:complete len:210 (-),score=23.07 TRINITY_DN2608_c0_g1_i1:202-831(-)
MRRHLFMGDGLYTAHRLPDNITVQTAVMAAGALSLLHLSTKEFPVHHPQKPLKPEGDMDASLNAGFKVGAHILLADEARHVTALRIAHMLEQAGVRDTIVQIAARMSQSAAVRDALQRKHWYLSLPRRLRMWLLRINDMYDSPGLARVTVSTRDAYMVDCTIHYLHTVEVKSKIATMTVGGLHLHGVVRRLQQHGYEVVAANVILPAAH